MSISFFLVPKPLFLHERDVYFGETNNCTFQFFYLFPNHYLLKKDRFGPFLSFWFLNRYLFKKVIFLFWWNQQFHYPVLFPVFKPLPLKEKGPTRHWPMAHRILNMPIVVTNCHNVLQACLFHSTGQCRHVCSGLLVRLSVTPLKDCAKAMACLQRGPW